MVKFRWTMLGRMMTAVATVMVTVVAVNCLFHGHVDWMGYLYVLPFVAVFVLVYRVIDRFHRGERRTG